MDKLPNKVSPKSVFIPDDQHRQMSLMRANGDIESMQNFVSLAIEEKLAKLPYRYIYVPAQGCWCKVGNKKKPPQ